MPTRGGPAALTVPGVVSGWWQAHRHSAERMGSPITWHALLDAGHPPCARGFSAVGRPAARDGISAGAVQRLRTRRRSDAPSGRSIIPIVSPRTLRPARSRADPRSSSPREGPRSFTGAIWRSASPRAAKEAGSPLTREDLAAHRADWVEPLRVPYRGGEAASFPPPTQGFAALAILALLEGFDLAAAREDEYVHLVVEATKLAFEDRDRYLTDPTVVPVPVEHCLDLDRLARRRRRIGPARGRAAGGAAGRGRHRRHRRGRRAGNAVALIQSLYHEFGAGVVAGDTGVLLQNRGAFFSLDPAHPNRLAPGKRPAHTLIPSMYLVGGRPRLVYGTMGGEGQPQTQAALVTRMVDRRMGPQAAVEAPRWLLGRTWGEETRALRLESRYSPEVVQSLERRGHDVRAVEAWSDLMGHAHAIRVDADGLLGGSDPRADGAALGI